MKKLLPILLISLFSCTVQENVIPTLAGSEDRILIGHISSDGDTITPEYYWRDRWVWPKDNEGQVETVLYDVDITGNNIYRHTDPSATSNCDKKDCRGGCKQTPAGCACEEGGDDCKDIITH